MLKFTTLQPCNTLLGLTSPLTSIIKGNSIPKAAYVSVEEEIDGRVCHALGKEKERGSVIYMGM